MLLLSRAIKDPEPSKKKDEKKEKWSGSETGSTIQPRPKYMSLSSFDDKYIYIDNNSFWHREREDGIRGRDIIAGEGKKM